MATTIITKHSATAKDPAPNQLERGELAIDLERKNIYTKDASDEVVQLGGRPVKIGATAPPTPQEGDLWMEVPVAVDAPAMMWVYDGAKWLEHPSGVDGSPGADGADAKQIWSENTPDGDIYYSKGNVNIGRSDDIGAVVGIGGETITASFNNGLYIGRSGFTTQYNSEGLYATDHYLINTGGTTNLAMVIDADGRVGIGGEPSRSTKEIEEEAVSTLATWDSKDKKPTKSELIKRLTERNIGGGSAKLQVSGGAYVGGVTETLAIQGSVSGKYGLSFNDNTGKTITPIVDGAAVGNQVSLGNATRTFKDGYFSGTVDAGGFTVNGSPLTRNKDLIETLSTLRNATKDETVDVRQALASACDKLIEKFEAMQSPATQEITNED